ncbi:hypothetical protein [Finegoldia sp. BIOML-A1]|uniref:hypothetical protein n=1 Tax=Finegoldia sp. BIOML-A1 TaxID=2584649 RepID=UPI0012B12D4D|nr:hypothetical protein [Finegoldia sp. BIOML-A1]MSB11398.1 hypothetical protein [Finegoldia sp. BIOML-A1]
MFELKKLYKSLIFPVLVIIFCVYSYVTLNSIKYEYTDQDYKYFIKTRDNFENTMMESFAFSKSSDNKEEQQKYLDYSKMNFNSLQYIKPLEYDVSMLMGETKSAKYSSKTEHNFYNELLIQYDEIKSFKQQNNLNKLTNDEMFSELDSYFNLIRDEINRYGFYTTSNNFSFFKSFGFLMENVMNDIFLCVVFLIAVFANEMNFKNLKLDTISVSSKKLVYARLVKYVVFFAVVILSMIVGNIIYSVVNGFPIGSANDMILKSVTDIKINMPITMNVNSMILALKYIGTGFLIYSIAMMLYEIFRRYMKQSLSIIVVLSIYWIISLLCRRYNLSFSLNSFHNFGNLSILVPILFLLMTFCLIIVNNNRYKFIYHNFSKTYSKIDIKNILQLDFAKIMRSKLYKYFCVLTVMIVMLFCFNTIKFKNIKSKDDLQTIDMDIEAAQINVQNNPKDRGFKQTLINLENFKKSYVNRANDPAEYFNNMLVYLNSKWGFDVEGIDPSTSRTNENRVNYFIDNHLKPDSSYELVSNEIEQSLLSNKKLKLYKTKQHAPTEQKGLIGNVISMYENGIIPAFTLIICLMFTLEFKKERSNGTLKLAFVNEWKKDVWKSKQINSFVLSVGMYVVILAISMIIGLFNGGLGEKLYPVFCYDYSYNGVVEGVFRASSGFILPMILINILIILLVVSFSNMMTTFIKNETVNIIATTFMIVLGIIISYFGTLGKFFLLNPFSSLDSLMILKGGYNYLNEFSFSNPIYNVIMIVFYIVVFNLISMKRMKGDINA